MLESINSYSIGLLTGRVALILYLLTLLPGICRRLRIRHKIVSLLTLHRKKIGITMYVFAIVHALFLVALSLKIPAFRIFGLLTFLVLTPLFLTANTSAVRKLGRNWKKLHQLTYPALGLLFLHLALIRLSFFSVAAFGFLILLIVSFIVEGLRKPVQKSV